MDGSRPSNRAQSGEPAEKVSLLPEVNRWLNAELVIRGKKGRGKRPIKVEYINAYDFNNDTLHHDEDAKNIGRVYGSRDMYADSHEEEGDKYHIEDLLGKLEDKTAKVLQKLDLAVSKKIPLHDCLQECQSFSPVRGGGV